MKLGLMLSVTLLAAFFLSCAGTESRQQVQSPKALLESAMKEVNVAAEARTAAETKGDLDGWLAHYTEDAVWMPPHSDVIIGRDLARERLRPVFERISIEESQESADQELLGPGVLLDRGSYTIQMTPKKGGEPVSDAGSYLTIWKKGGDGKWRITHQVWTSQRSMMPAAKEGGR